MLQQQLYHQHHHHQVAAAAAAAAASRDLAHHPLSPKPPFGVTATGTARPTPPSGPKPEPETITVSSSDEEEASVRRKREDAGGRREDDDAVPERKVETAAVGKSAENTPPACVVAEAAASKPTPASPGVPIKEEPLNSSSEEAAGIKAEAAKVSSSEADADPLPSAASPASPCDQRVPEPNAKTTTILATIKTEVRDSIESETAAATSTTAAVTSTITKEEPETVCAGGEFTRDVPDEVELKDDEETTTELKTAAVPDFESDLKLLCAETLLAFSSRSVEVIEEVDDLEAGLDLLAEGAAMRDREEGATCGGCDLLRMATRADAECYGVHEKSINWTRMDLCLLQTVTAYEYQQQVNWVDPMSRLRAKYDHHHYSSAESESRCRSYIAHKMKQKEMTFDAEGNQVVVEDEYMGIKSLAAVIKKIKNTEIMSQLEVDLRAQLVQLQSLYRDKQKEMARLKASPKKRTGSRSGSSSSRQQRGPGRPKKRKLKSNSSKTKMGRPRKGSTHSKQPLPVIEEEREECDDNDKAEKAEESDEEFDEPEEEMDDEVEEEDEESEEEEEENNAAEEELDVDDLPPPVLEPCEPPTTPPKVEEVEERPQRPPNPFANLTSAFGAPSSTSASSGLLKPPKLTASLSPPRAESGGTTNLSDIKARFMKGRANPFATLMKLASGPESSRASSKHEDEDDGDNEESDDDNEDEGGNGNESSKASSASEDEFNDDLTSKTEPSVSKTASKRAPSDLSSAEDSAGCSSSKKRKSDKPRKHMGATETIVPKQSKNLFMMNCVNLQRGFKSTSAEAARALSNSSKDKEDEYDFTEDDEATAAVNASPGLTRIKQAKIFSDYRSSPTFGTAAAAALAESAKKGEGKPKKKRRSEEGTWKTSTSTATSPKTSTPRRRSTGGEKEEKKQQQLQQMEEHEQPHEGNSETLLAKPQKPPPPHHPPQQPIKCGTELDSSNEYYHKY